jgi:aryl-alcohol dehydrogenase-like predicted oxidoreductase
MHTSDAAAPRWSRAGLGTAPLGSRPDGPLWWGDQDRALSVRTVQAAIDAGVTWVDTAPFYGWGRAEEIVGEAVVGRRDEVVLLTKCGTVQRRSPAGGWAEDGSPAAVRVDVEASLRRLRTERIDVVQLHDPDPTVPVEETVGALASLVAGGLVAAIGLSNHPVALLERGAAIAPIAVVQHQWNLLEHGSDAGAAAAWSAANGARFLAWSPLASGFLADGFDLEALHPDDLRRRLPWATGDGADRLSRLRAAAAELGEPLQRLAAAWAARVGHPIVGARSPAEATAIAAVEPLDDERASLLERAAG